MDVRHFLFRNLHFHRDVSDVDDAAQLVAGIEMLIQLAFDERRGDDAVDRSADFRLAEFLIEDCDLLLQLGDVALPPGGSARAGFPPSSSFSSLSASASSRVLRSDSRSDGFRKHANRGFGLADVSSRGR